MEPLSGVKIVSRAIALADERGIGALSMRKLAADLSVTPMALYWYFPNKEALLDAMAERAAAELTFQDDVSASWQDRLRANLAANLGAFRLHPWLPPLVKGRIVLAPNYLQILEALLDAIRLAGYPVADAVQVADFAVDGVAAIAHTLALREAPPRPPSSPERLALYREEVLLAAETFPRIREAVVPLTQVAEPDPYPGLAIEVLVRGIEAAAPRVR